MFVTVNYTLEEGGPLSKGRVIPDKRNTEKWPTYCERDREVSFVLIVGWFRSRLFLHILHTHTHIPTYIHTYSFLYTAIQVLREKIL